ncbi:MAG TPA: SRPBCC family protein [Solirubrobacteraceae bacterium]|nr:SRPBCC family protein [Solirubrobacteraceae bacterium]
MATTARHSAVVTLPTDTQILITREFDAPRHLVYRVWTTPELIRRWWSARRGEVTVAEVDLRVGGRWRYAMIANGGFEVAFHGEFREVVPNERLVRTEVYEAFPEAPAVSTETFTESDGRTTVTMLIEHELMEHRDAHVQSGMEDGLQDALDLVDDIIASLN